MADGDRSTAVIAVACACLSLATIMVAVRLYTRMCLVKRIGLDDYLAAASLLCLYGEGIAITMNTSYGLGRHVASLNGDSIFLYNRVFYISIVLYVTALLFIKATILMQYYRLFSVSSLRTIFIVAMILVLGWSFTQLFVVVFTCTPVAAFWDPSLQQKASCMNQLTMAYINAAANIVTEVSILTLPLPVLRSLNLPKAQRWILIGMFSMGFLTIVISGVRIRHLRLSADFTWDNVYPACLSLAEITCALTCACLLTLRPIVSRMNPRRSRHLQHKPDSFTPSEGRDSYGNSPARRFLATMESREGLYDDKYMMTADSYEIESGRGSTTITKPLEPPAPVATKSYRDIKRAKSQSELERRLRRMASLCDRDKRSNAVKSCGEMDWAQLGIGTQPSVTTNIGSQGNKVKSVGIPTPKWEIGIYREVYQTTASR